MYLRFIALEIDNRTELAKGLFTIAYELAKSKTLQEYELAELKEILKWFETNIPIPTKFSRKKNVSHRETKGISWIKATDTETVSKLYALKVIVERHGFLLEVIKTDRPGYIVYEDKHQVVAEPFKEK